MTRTFVVGDIHGCYDELLELLDRAALSSDDRIIAIGDLVNRGPQSAQTLDFFRRPDSPNIQSIRGNHEHRHVRIRRGEAIPTLSVLVTRWELGAEYDDAVTFMDSLPLYLDLPEALLVHAFYEPGVPLEEQREDILVGVNGSEAYLRRAYKRRWYRYYEGEKPLIVGHRDWTGDMEPLIYKDRVYGIDTRCVYGGWLTGLVLPEFELISVPARRNHWADMRAAYSKGPR
jgi:serine/threonine protein phosphatase 1